MSDSHMVDDLRARVAALPTARLPEHVWQRIDARIRNRDIVLLPLGDAPRPRIRTPRFVAAALVIVLAVGVAAAVSFQPFREWVRDLAADGGAPASPEQAPAVSEVPTPAPPVMLRVDADESGRLRVDFIGPSAELQLRVLLTEGPSMEISASGHAAAAQFRSSRGRIVVTNPASGVVLLKVPRGARAVDITVDGRVLMSKRGASVRLTVPADTSGAEFILPVR